MMRTRDAAVGLVLFAAAAAAAGEAPAWRQLFNGKDLAGWKVKIAGHDLGDNFGNTFRVEDGVLKVGYDAYADFGGKFGHIFYNEEFSHYLLRVEYRFTGDQTPGGPGWAFRNSGIMIHGQAPETMAKDQSFPVSIEVQLLGGSGTGTRTTANLCTPGTNVVMNGRLHTQHCTNSTSKTYHGDQWVTVLLEVRGGSVIRHKIDGETVLEYAETQLDPQDGDAKKLCAAGQELLLRRGTISLQSESHPVEFRRVEILELDEDAPGARRIDPADSARPNVIVVITDDQGYGELSSHGNPVLRTPHLDRLRGESVRFTDFHAAPMCTPTRGQLMTGRDALRNGAMNVSSGRTLLRRGIPTMADLFAASGWRTGLFGKWHLGDAYPYRPQDRGFHESLWFPSSHIGSLPDAWENDYFDDTYIRNGRARAFKGYTTDVFFGEAIAWMKAEAAAGRPFFCYLATAAPHGPHFVPDRYRAPVRAALEAAREKLAGQRPGETRAMDANVERELVSYLAMIANIDEHMGRLDAFLREQGLRENTLLIFLTDNGSTFGPRYFNAGMKGGKVTLWEGGHRVPCFVRWPAGGLRPAGDVGGLTQVQDILPTLVDLLGLQAPAGARFDGASLAGVLRGNAPVPQERMLVVNYSRMPLNAVHPTTDNAAVPRRTGAAVLWKRWRLLEDTALYDLDDDPLQERNVIERHPEVAAAMRAHLDAWWDGVKDHVNVFSASVIGDEQENPVTLSACEWADVFVDQQAQVRRGARKIGAWHIEVAAAGEYAFTLRRWPYASGLRLRDGVAETRVTDGVLPAGEGWPVAEARLRAGGTERRAAVGTDARAVRFVLPLAAGRTTLEAAFLGADGGEIAGAYYVTAERLPAVARPVKLILDTDMSGDADDAGALALLHALADRGECELLATVVNRADRTRASAAAVDAINTYYGRPDLPIGTDKAGPTALQRTSQYASGLRDGFPHNSLPDDRMPDALDVYRRVLAAQPDGSVTVCSVGALSNLAELWRREPALVRAKVRRVVVMGGEFPPKEAPETNIATHPDAARFFAAEWPTEIVWQGFEVGRSVMTGEALGRTPAANPVRRAYELRIFGKRPSIEGGQPSYDQAAALYAVRGSDPELWAEQRGGRVAIDGTGLSQWVPDPSGRHVVAGRACRPEHLGRIIEDLMIRPPAAGG